MASLSDADVRGYKQTFKQLNMYHEDSPEQGEDVKSSRVTEIVSLLFVTIVMVFLFVKIVFF